MRNRSAIWIFTILLFLACLYQLSFSWVTQSFESDIHPLAETKYDSLSNEAVEFVINGDTLVIGPDKEKQQIVSFYEQKLLAEKVKFFFNRLTTKNVLKKINSDVFKYFQIKTFTSFLTGIFTFLILYFFDRDLAPTLGFLHSFLILYRLLVL